MNHELVSDWMSQDVITITPDTSLAEADKLMITHTIRRLPVVDNGRLVGIVTYGDVREARPAETSSLSIWEMAYLLSTLKAEAIMTRNPRTISAQAHIGEAAQLMMRYMISGLPVVDDDGEMIGIITESDIFRMVVHDWVRLNKMESAQPYAHYH